MSGIWAGIWMILVVLFWARITVHNRAIIWMCLHWLTNGILKQWEYYATRRVQVWYDIPSAILVLNIMYKTKNKSNIKFQTIGEEREVLNLLGRQVRGLGFGGGGAKNFRCKVYPKQTITIWCIICFLRHDQKSTVKFGFGQKCSVSTRLVTV